MPTLSQLCNTTAWLYREDKTELLWLVKDPKGLEPRLNGKWAQFVGRGPRSIPAMHGLWALPGGGGG